MIQSDNVVKAQNDYRVLQPRLVTDPNDNRTEVRFDALGMVVGTAVMGKAAGPIEGDSFASFVTDLPPTADQRLLRLDRPAPARHRSPRHRPPPALSTTSNGSLRAPPRLPAKPMSAILPLASRPGAAQFRLLRRLRPRVQKKIQAEPGPLDPTRGAPSVHPRWVGTG